MFRLINGTECHPRVQYSVHLYTGTRYSTVYTSVLNVMVLSSQRYSTCTPLYILNADYYSEWLIQYMDQ